MRATSRSTHPRSGGQGAPTIPQDPPGEPAPFPSSDELLEAARQMLYVRRRLAEAHEQNDDSVDLAPIVRAEGAWSQYWHKCFEMTKDQVPPVGPCRAHDLSALEREVLIALLLDRLALNTEVISTSGDVLGALAVPGVQVVEALRALSKYGKLHNAGLISYRDPDEDPRDQRLILDPSLIEAVLHEQGEGCAGWQVKTQKDLYEKMAELSYAYRKKSDALLPRRFSLSDDAYRHTRQVKRLRWLLDRTLEAHRKWRLKKLLGHAGIGSYEQDMILVLLGKELGHIPVESDLFTGQGLACAASEKEADIARRLDLLRRESALCSEKLIAPAGGPDVLLSDDPSELEHVEFQLGERGLEILKLNKRCRRKRSGGHEVREPLVHLEQLVLSEAVLRALRMAIAQARSAAVLCESWGMARALPYGRAVTLIFSGPPGVGKTACAEALAAELAWPILVADYSKVQNCYVGQTEKNIVRTFARAHESGAVLLWDEADAMFFDRDAASRTWEVRHVNVLLQQIERFDGVCILATNRVGSLDKALERRISMKVHFERPGPEARREIWARLVPPEMPIADDVDLDRLSEPDLTGGEIKNAVLNAARLALSREEDSRVTMADFNAAIEMETEGKWSAGGGKGIGFAADSSGW